jgi:4-hydroxy-2-oxoheptanedioate aldolase
MTLKEKMKKGPVFGMACFTGVSSVIESMGYHGLDFVYLDLEHTPWMLSGDFEKQIMAARIAGISVLVRMADNDEVAIRKVLEWGAEGVVIPHCRSAGDAEESVRAAKFSPAGRRGGESNVRAARFGSPGFDWNRYIESQNKDTLVIPMDEDFEFTENIDEILSVQGIDAINFGPIDYAISLNLPIGYSMDGKVKAAFDTLVKKSREKGIGVLGPVVPPNKENIQAAIRNGYTMLILGNDMWHFQGSLKNMMKESVSSFISERDSSIHKGGDESSCIRGHF